MRLTKLANECGCTLGSVVMTVVGIAVLVAAAVTFGLLSIEFLLAIPVVLIASLLGGGAGKLVGIRIAARRWHRLVNALVTAESSQAIGHMVSTAS